MLMAFPKEESEISVVNEDLHDAGNVALKGQFDEDIKEPVAVIVAEDGWKSSCRAAADFLLCLLILTGLISLTLVTALLFRVTRHNSEREMKMAQLQSSYSSLISETHQLENNNLTKERDHFLARCNNLTKERDQLQTSYSDLTKEKKKLQKRFDALTKNRTDLQRELQDVEASCKALTEERAELRKSLKDFEWLYFRGSFYHISSVKKTWQESRDDCLQKGADLMIINSKQEQNFTRQFRKLMWIGLTDAETEGTWKWVDGTPMNKSYWGPQEPNGEDIENCGHIKFLESENNWNDEACTSSHFSICEKKFLQ